MLTKKVLPKYRIRTLCVVCDNMDKCRPMYVDDLEVFICRTCNNLQHMYTLNVLQDYIKEKTSNVIYTDEDIHTYVDATCDFKLQSAETKAIDVPDVEPALEEEETVTFLDENLGMEVGYTPDKEWLVEKEAVNNATLSQFLSRPVDIFSQTWSQSDLQAVSIGNFNPWALFFNNIRVRNKLQNFAYIRCNLKLKFMINASPFYYGAINAIYQPLPQFTPSTVKGVGTQQSLMPLSQRPHLFMYPQNSQGGEMMLPFFYPKNWLRINTLADFTGMGNVQLIPFSALRSANGVTGSAVTIQVLAWAEDVVLSGATISLALQSGAVPDEYGVGPISRPASTVAKIANMLRKAPVIGKFATATEIGARAVSGIASLFGFTNVPVIADTMPYRPSAFPQLASTQIGFPVEKLTLDPKNELALDPTVCGATNDDELAIDCLVQKESFLTSFDWLNTDTVNTLLFTTRVTPFMFRASGNTNNSIVDTTPMGMITNAFQHWRGDIIFRFKVLCSPYHKGRMYISFDPSGAGQNLTNNAPTMNAVFTQVVDIGQQDDIEVKIPYTQYLAYLNTNTSFQVSNIPYQIGSGATFNQQAGVDNGILTVRVQTTLTAPVANAPITILVSVRGADNMEFANPVSVGTTVSQFQVQSEEYACEQSLELVSGTPGPLVDANRQKINFGETVRSMRTLLRRSNFVQSIGSPNGSTAGTVNEIIYRFGKLPPQAGYDPAGIFTANQLLGVSTARYNYAQLSVLNWMLPSYIGYRGSGIWTFNEKGNIATPSVNVTRTNQNLLASGIVFNNVASTNTNTLAYQAANGTVNTAGGISLTNQLTNAGLSVLCPMYTNYRFQTTDPTFNTAPQQVITATNYDGAAMDSFRYQSHGLGPNQLNSNRVVDCYWGCGTDFQPIFFLNCASWYRQTVLPTAP